MIWMKKSSVRTKSSLLLQVNFHFLLFQHARAELGVLKQSERQVRQERLGVAAILEPPYARRKDAPYLAKY
jgi:hypothetical protein